jgi:chaperonin GroES
MVPLSVPEATPGGIILPETSEERKRVREGLVLCVGEEVRKDLVCGTRVVFACWAGAEVTIEGERLTWAREQDILCIVEID